MGGMDHQLGFFTESTYGTSGTPTRFFEYDSENIEEEEGRTEGDPLRVGSGYIRSDRSTPYFAGAKGNVSLAVLSKGFGYFLTHMLGAVATTGPAETVVYTHTGTEGELLGDSFSMQMNRPFNPSGSNQPFLYKGGKITDWTLSNSVEDNLMLELGMDFQQVDTATALASPVYPTGMDNLTWAGGVINIGGSNYDVTEFSLKNDNGLDTERRQIRGLTDKKEPTASRRDATWSLKADFESMAQRTRAHATTRAATIATIIGTWNGPVLLGTTLFPQYKITIPAARFDKWKGATEGTDAIEQELSGVVRFNAASPITVAYATADTTP